MPFVADELDTDADGETIPRKLSEFRYEQIDSVGFEVPAPHNYQPGTLQSMLAKLGLRKHAAPVPDSSNSQLVSHLVPLLQSAGVRELYGQYDFDEYSLNSWFVEATMVDGRMCDVKEVVPVLLTPAAKNSLVSGNFLLPSLTYRTIDEQFADLVCRELADTLVQLLLHRPCPESGVQFGGFRVNLDTCRLSDDPNAGPNVENIEVIIDN